MPVFHSSALPWFRQVFRALSDCLQAVRKILHQRVLHFRRKPLPTEPPKPFGNAVTLHQLSYLTDCGSSWFRN
jgi:hypothetical protein